MTQASWLDLGAMVGRRPGRAVLAAALATVALMGGFAASAPGAYAHSTFLESTPAPGARVATARPS